MPTVYLIPYKIMFLSLFVLSDGEPLERALVHGLHEVYPKKKWLRKGFRKENSKQ